MTPVCAELQFNKPMLAIAALLASTPLAASVAAPFSGVEVHSRAAGGEFRGYGSTRRSHLEDVIWRFRLDGRVTSMSQIRRGSRAGQFIEYGDTGTWRIESNRLCVEFASVHRDLSGCYRVDHIGRDHVRLIGPVQFEGTLSR